ncbi:MAG: copper homeostasis protein CutC [Terracidiphilus sp.]|jgi:copper homeostasis protein
MKTFLFEVCAESVEAAQAAESGGADRIELCSQLPIGGVTPEIELIRAAVGALSIPVHVLIRPRGGDFAFSADEFGLMRRQIELAKEAGAAGVAVGVLLPDGSVDVERTRELVELGRPMNVTFHRSFDETSNLFEALEAVIETGADCLLTSGGAPDVLTGAESIAQLRKQAGERLVIMAGGGLRLHNLLEIVRRTGVSHLHGSMTRARERNGKIESPEGNGSAAGGHIAVSWPAMLEADVREAARLLRDEFTTMDFAARPASR